MRVALGTAQWGLNYGITNTKGMPSDKELKLIISKANKNNICVFDTASQYGDSEIRLGNNNLSVKKIVTKVAEFEDSNLEEKLLLSLDRLKASSVYGYLFHKPNVLDRNEQLWNQMKGLKAKGLTKKIGFSLYEPSQLTQFLKKKMIPDIIQIPYSVFDRKFEPYFNSLKTMNIEIHVRSIFLQGLYFKSADELEKKFNSLRSPIEKLNQISRKYDLSLLDILIGFVKLNKLIDYLIIGVETINQLNEILESYRHDTPKQVFEEIKKIKIKNKSILNPINW